VRRADDDGGHRAVGVAVGRGRRCPRTPRSGPPRAPYRERRLGGAPPGVDRARLDLRPQTSMPSPKRLRQSTGISGLSARALICWTLQVLPSGSLKPKNVPPSRSSKTCISLHSTRRLIISALPASRAPHTTI